MPHLYSGVHFNNIMGDARYTEFVRRCARGAVYDIHRKPIRYVCPALVPNMYSLDISEADLIYESITSMGNAINYIKNCPIRVAKVDDDTGLRAINKLPVYSLTIDGVRVQTEIKLPILKYVTLNSLTDLNNIPRNIYGIFNNNVDSKIIYTLMSDRLSTVSSMGPIDMQRIRDSNIVSLSMDVDPDQWTGEDLEYTPRTMRHLEIGDARIFNYRYLMYINDIPLKSFMISSRPPADGQLDNLPWKSLKNVQINAIVNSSIEQTVNMYNVLQNYKRRYPNVIIIMSSYPYTRSPEYVGLNKYLHVRDGGIISYNMREPFGENDGDRIFNARWVS